MVRASSGPRERPGLAGAVRLLHVTDESTPSPDPTATDAGTQPQKSAQPKQPKADPGPGEQFEVRAGKRERLRSGGWDPYPVSVPVTTTIAAVREAYSHLEAGDETDDVVGVAGRVVFDHVRFSYNPGTELITDLNLVVEPGQTVAIVGPTGAGKTTLVNLLLRFYDPQAGTISLDGVDTTRLTRDELREQIGMVLQDTWLFEGTIRENIAFGAARATDEQVLAAARAASVDHIVSALPKGYDTVIDDSGAGVSAGEKQLITIARAFLADRQILVLDEATSSVDTRTELLVQQAMVGLRAGRTSFVIAHRLSTIRDADVILVMEHGDIVEQGGHDELIARRGAYYELYQSQFAGPVSEELAVERDPLLGELGLKSRHPRNRRPS